MTRLLLLRKDYLFLPYGSLEHFIEKSLHDYQKNMLVTSDGQAVNPDPQGWQEMFLEGMLSLQDLHDSVASGAIDTVLVAMTDMYGRLLGKRYDARFLIRRMVPTSTALSCHR